MHHAIWHLIFRKRGEIWRGGFDSFEFTRLRRAFARGAPFFSPFVGCGCVFRLPSSVFSFSGGRRKIGTGRPPLLSLASLFPLLLFLGWDVVPALGRPYVRDVSRVCNAVATGDLTQKITVPVQGDLMVQLKKRSGEGEGNKGGSFIGSGEIGEGRGAAGCLRGVGVQGVFGAGAEDDGRGRRTAPSRAYARGRVLVAGAGAGEHARAGAVDGRRRAFFSCAGGATGCVCGYPRCSRRTGGGAGAGAFRWEREPEAAAGRADVRRGFSVREERRGACAVTPVARVARGVELELEPFGGSASQRRLPVVRTYGAVFGRGVINTMVDNLGHFATEVTRVSRDVGTEVQAQRTTGGVAAYDATPADGHAYRSRLPFVRTCGRAAGFFCVGGATGCVCGYRCRSPGFERAGEGRDAILVLRGTPAPSREYARGRVRVESQRCMTHRRMDGRTRGVCSGGDVYLSAPGRLALSANGLRPRSGQWSLRRRFDDCTRSFFGASRWEGARTPRPFAPVRSISSDRCMKTTASGSSAVGRCLKELNGPGRWIIQVTGWVIDFQSGNHAIAFDLLDEIQPGSLAVVRIRVI
ncbi:hypothetical protein C8F04DRAFT_1310891 [Mycena alexandri]|uniref:Uncharacterized protein n=1 Tax=Mycena alexandri TaxID=1745969 RepID=A0AAD6X9N3_9AGAR|nr:hypothetical protein C8F04DRAFT_1310891 [Mycena alexandri]